MARCSRGGLVGLRLRRLVSFLRRNRLHATAHTLERQSGVFFDTAYLRRMLLDDRWAAASSPCFQYIYGNLDGYKECQTVRNLLLSMRSDETKSSILYRRLKPMAVEVIMDLVAKCPELQARTRLPRCTFDPAYITSLGPGLWESSSHQKNKIGRIPARDLARSFLRKRPPHHIGHSMNHSGISRCHQDSHPGNSE